MAPTFDFSPKKISQLSSFNVDVTPEDTYATALPKYDDAFTGLQSTQAGLLQSLLAKQNKGMSGSQTAAALTLGLLPILAGYAMDKQRGAVTGAQVGMAGSQGVMNAIKTTNQRDMAGDLLAYEENEKNLQKISDKKQSLSEKMLADKESDSRLGESLQNQKALIDYKNSKDPFKSGNIETPGMKMQRERFERMNRLSQITGYEDLPGHEMSPEASAKLRSEIIIPNAQIAAVLDELKTVANPYNLQGDDATKVAQLSSLLVNSLRKESGSGANLTGTEEQLLYALVPKLAAGTGLFDALKGTAFERDPAGAIASLQDILLKKESSALLAAGKIRRGLAYSPGVIKRLGIEQYFDEGGMFVGEAAPGWNSNTGVAIDPNIPQDADTQANLKNAMQANGVDPALALAETFKGMGFTITDD